MAVEQPASAHPVVAARQAGWTVSALPVRHLCPVAAVPEATNIAVDVAVVFAEGNHPFGTVMPLDRRHAMVEWSERTGGYLVDLSTEQASAGNGSPLPALFTLAAGERIAMIGTVGDSLAPAGLAYLVAPRELTPLMADLISRDDGGVTRTTSRLHAAAARRCAGRVVEHGSASPTGSSPRCSPRGRGGSWRPAGRGVPRRHGRGHPRPADLASLLRRLGVRSRGFRGAARRGRPGPTRPGRGLRPPPRRGSRGRARVLRTPPPDLVAVEEYDPPLERVDVAAFAGRALAERLYERLAGHGLAATRLGIEARTAAGEELHRMCATTGCSTRPPSPTGCAGSSTAGCPARRGASGEAARPPGSSGCGCCPTGWSPRPACRRGCGARSVRRARRRAGAGAEGMLGPEAVVTGVADGGRGHDDQVRLVVWGDEAHPAGADAPGQAGCRPRRPRRPDPTPRPSRRDRAGLGDGAARDERRARPYRVRPRGPSTSPRGPGNATPTPNPSGRSTRWWCRTRRAWSAAAPARRRPLRCSWRSTEV
ncbi:hypothetical protein ACFQX7_29165, partial [Luedemannella flava]